MAKEVQEKCILHWNYRGFIELPEVLKVNGEHIEEIYLKWNGLLELPRWLGLLKNLTNLYLYGNELESLPREIEELHSLTYLDIGQNQLTCLPANISKLQNLTVLAATNNHLTYLPEEMKYLSLLQILQLSGNKLQTIPDSICECESLEVLYLDENCLVNLPPQIVYLPKLCVLSLTGNQLLYLPSLPFMSFVNLRFDNNPCLSYVAYPLGCQVTSYNQTVSPNGFWNLKSFGCFQSSVSVTSYMDNIVLQVSPDSNERYSAMQLIMPHGLLTVCKPEENTMRVPSLYEIAMRATYSLLYHHRLDTVVHNGCFNFSTSRKSVNTWDKAVILTHYIKKELKKGPITICFHPNCQVPIFTHAVVWIIPKGDIFKNKVTYVLATIFFCSHDCSSSYQELEVSSLNEGQEECLSLSRTEWKIRFSE